MKRTVLALAALAVMTTSLSGCKAITRLSEVGDGPQMTPIINPTKRPDYKPVSLPMPAPKLVEHNPNSLWRAGARAFFKDQRAKEVGDILTVQLKFTEKAVLNNKTERTRDDSEQTGVPNLLGIEAEFTKKLPEGLDPANFINFGSDHSTKGDGTIDRKEEIDLKVAAVITQILPNGNLVVAGRQELRVNAELRELMVTGVVRPEDIDTTNTISHEKIAEMRMAYGGRGSISELQQPRWGTQIWDILFPF